MADDESAPARNVKRYDAAPGEAAHAKNGRASYASPSDGATGFNGPRVAPAEISREEASRLPCSKPREPLGGFGRGLRGLLSCGVASARPAPAFTKTPRNSGVISRTNVAERTSLRARASFFTVNSLVLTELIGETIIHDNHGKPKASRPRLIVGCERGTRRRALSRHRENRRVLRFAFHFYFTQWPNLIVILNQICSWLADQNRHT